MDLRNVVDYGAVDDGMTTDDTQAFEDAIAAGGTLYVPNTANGFYVTDELVINHKHPAIVGDSRASKIINGVPKNQGKYLFRIKNTSEPTVSALLRDFSLIGKNTTDVGGGIIIERDASYGYEATLERVHIGLSNEKGLFFDKIAKVTLIDVNINDCDLQAFHAKGCRNIVSINGEFIQSGDGIKLEECALVQIISGYSQSNNRSTGGKYGLHVIGGASVYLRGVGFECADEYDHQSHIYFERDSSGNPCNQPVIDNCLFDTNVIDAWIHLNGTRRAELHNMAFGEPAVDKNLILTQYAYDTRLWNCQVDRARVNETGCVDGYVKMASNDGDLEIYSSKGDVNLRYGNDAVGLRLLANGNITILKDLRVEGTLNAMGNARVYGNLHVDGNITNTGPEPNWS